MREFLIHLLGGYTKEEKVINNNNVPDIIKKLIYQKKQENSLYNDLSFRRG